VSGDAGHRERRRRATQERDAARRDAVAELGGPLFAVRSPLLGEPMMSGWRRGKTGLDSVRAQQAALSGWEAGEVDVETSTVLWTGKPSNVARQLLGSDRVGPPDFPFSSTVTHETMTMRVEGRRRQVPLYRCGHRWVIPVRAGGRHVTITGRLVDPATVEVIRLRDDGAAALDAAEAWHRDFEARMRAAEGADADG
jgi:hypothetical protein